MTAALRKQAERRRRAARGEVALSGWLSASDHAALTQMARDSGMTQAQAVSRLIGMVGRIEGLERWTTPMGYSEAGWDYVDPEGQWVRHSDLTAAIGLNTAKAGNEGEG